MRAARATEVAQHPSPRGPASRTSSSNSDPLQSRARTEKSPKLSDTRSAASNPKKLGTRIADLESQLGLAQEELKCLKDQLATTEVAKKAAQNQLKPKKPEEKKKKKGDWNEKIDDSRHETDVFEVPVEEVAIELIDEESEPQPNPLFDELASKKDEISALKINLEQNDRELEDLRLENANLINQLEEKSSKLASAQSELDQLKSKLQNVEHDLENSRANISQITSRMELAEKAKDEMENEMRRLTIHTEQWRKAADAAAAVLSGGAGDVNCGKISERCGSMDAHYVNSLGFAGFIGSPAMMDDPHDVFGTEKRKGSGIRMLGDMLKKKNNQK